MVLGVPGLGLGAVDGEVSGGGDLLGKGQNPVKVDGNRGSVIGIENRGFGGVIANGEVDLGPIMRSSFLRQRRMHLSHRGMLRNFMQMR